ncbi:hypothetical protein HNV11_06655 [Spirosoma taeanense]|uniref:Beta/gamma crystallin 'Greek key' domain-containing protein n=1 Tax=Spirosoma taeanense TaxID=2735870 RepID=A0A6M5Y8K9_9BACT|nr:RICIN domain-containing protein [Spirosoma taeanense]QJW89092.1 hypothetical protein HNV11_06655 [Spirosoma taeanense]
MKYLVLPTIAGSVNAPGLNPNKQYVIASADSTKVLTATVGGIKNKVIQQEWNESSLQLWKFKAGADGYLEIVNVETNNPMSIDFGSTAENSLVIFWPDHSGLDQNFKVQLLKNDRYRLLNQNSNKVVSVKAGSDDIVQQTSTGASTQQWSIMTASDYKKDKGFSSYATLYEDINYGSNEQKVGIGSYDTATLIFGHDKISSVRVPEDLRVTLFKDANFRGDKQVLTQDTPDLVQLNFNDVASSILIEPVATVYRDPNYTGISQKIGVGRYNIPDLVVGNDHISSIKVPQGLIVTLYKDAHYKGEFKVFTEDHPDLRVILNDMASSIVVKAIGVFMPPEAIKFGEKVILTNSFRNKCLLDTAGGGLAISGTISDGIIESEQFTLVRSGSTKNKDYVSFGDVVSLTDKNGHYVEVSANNSFKADNSQLTEAAKFVLIKSGDCMHNNFVSPGDTISLKTYNDGYLAGDPKTDNVVLLNNGAIGATAKFAIRTKEFDRSTSPKTQHHVPNSVESGICGAEACGADACGADACGADACGAAACGAAAGGLATCGVAASGLAICGADFAAIAVCGAAASAIGACGADAAAMTISGVAAGGVGVCGADACGAAACGAAACGAAACGAAACGADACGAAAAIVGAELANACSVDVAVAEANVVDVCASEASIIDVGLVDVCLANACAINLCAIDACVADACAIDIIPIIPFF